MKLKVYSPTGENASDKDFSIREFEGDKGLQALKQVVLAHMANKRQGTRSTKTQTTISGTGKKPFRQKGTGMGRQGARNRVHHYHGAVAHGPQPRDYSQKINKRMRTLAIQRALFDRCTEGEVDVIERFEQEEVKTKVMNGIIGKIAPNGKVLIVDDSWSSTVLLSTRNIARVYVTEAAELNALDLSRYDRIIVSEKGIEKLLQRLNGGN
jgi:large subunit ribosomal protein L4